MSDLHGKGYGDTHHWRNMGVQIHGHGVNNKFSEWECKECNSYFRHFYDRDTNIFEVIKQFNIPHECPARMELKDE